MRRSDKANRQKANEKSTPNFDGHPAHVVSSLTACVALIALQKILPERAVILCDYIHSPATYG
jgi:hypothetical protein